MRFVPVLTVFCLLASTSAFTVRPTNALTLNNISTSLTSAYTLIDPRFNLWFRSFGPAINKNQCLMNVVNAMVVFTLLDFNQEVGPSTFVSTKWPDIVITTRGEGPANQVEARFLIWGLFLGIFSMVQKIGFRTIFMALEWDDKPVGYITIAPKPEPLKSSQVIELDGIRGGGLRAIVGVISENESYGKENDTWSIPGNDSSSLNVSMTASIFANVSQATNITYTSDDLHIDIVRTGESLTANLVFLAILNALVYIAPYEKMTVVENFETSPSSPFDTTLQMSQLFPRPTLLDYGQVSQSMSELAEVYVSADKWPEVDFKIWKDKTPIGLGAIVKGRIEFELR